MPGAGGPPRMNHTAPRRRPYQHMPIHSHMDRLQPSQIASFLKRFHFLHGLLRRFGVRNHRSTTRGELVLSVPEGDAARRVRLRLVFDGVEEFRFQRRPGPGLVRLRQVRLGYFNGLFYLNLDAFADDGAPQLMDFRASDAYIAGRELAWEIVAPKS